LCNTDLQQLTKARVLRVQQKAWFFCCVNPHGIAVGLYISIKNPVDYTESETKSYSMCSYTAVVADR